MDRECEYVLLYQVRRRPILIVMVYKNKKGKSSKRRSSETVSSYGQWTSFQYAPPWYSHGRGKQESETFYKHAVCFRRPTRIEAIVKNYFRSPVVLLVNRSGKSFMLRPGEFFDLVSSADVVKKQLLKCNKVLIQGKKLSNLETFTELPPSAGRMFAERHLCSAGGRVVVQEGDLDEEEEENEVEVEDEDTTDEGTRRKRIRNDSNSESEEDEEGLSPPKKLKLP